MSFGSNLLQLVGMFREVSAQLARSQRNDDRVSPRAGHTDAWGYQHNQWEGWPDQKLPPNCPVRVLGKQDDLIWISDTMGQVQGIAATKRKPEVLFDLFAGHTNYVFHHWPQRNKDGPVFDNVEARQAWNCLLNEAYRLGTFDPIDRVRGRGGWAAGSNRELFVWHSGETIFVVHDGELKQRDPGMLGGKFYAAGPSIITPWLDPVTVEDCPARLVLDHLKTWKFQRPVLDPILMLGAIGCAFYSGALEQRPVSIIIGDRGVGKSSLIGMEDNGFLKRLLGDALIDAGNASEPGIVRLVGQDSRAIALDEFEQKADNNARAQAMIETIRQMYSGTSRVRAGDNNKAQRLRLQSPCFAAAVNPPAFENTDYSRMAIFNLGRFNQGSVLPEFPMDPAMAASMMLRRLMDGWGDFNKALKDWRGILRRAGHEPRFGDTFGTLLASAQVLLGEAGLEDAGVPMTGTGEALAAWVGEQTVYERSLISDNWRNCLEHLLSQTIVAWTDGQKPTVGAVIRDFEAGHHGVEAVRQRFACAGLGIINLADGRARGLHETLMRDPLFAERHATASKKFLFAIPHKGPSLNQLFAHTKWRDGAWTRTLRQAPGNVVLTGPHIPEYVKIGRVAERCTLIDLAGYDAETTGEQEDVIDG